LHFLWGPAGKTALVQVPARHGQIKEMPCFSFPFGINAHYGKIAMESKALIPILITKKDGIANFVKSSN
jgi:hypothetical protein